MYERDAITSGGDLRLSALRLEELLARETRLKAEASGATKLMFAPTDTTAKETASASAFAAQEQALFQARLEKFNNQVQTVRQAITLYEKEIQSLQAQIASEQKQAKAIEREIEELRALVGRGLAPAPRVLPLERTLAQAEREQRELETLVIRARQQINVSEQTIVTLRDERRGNAVAELQTVQAQVKEVSQKYNTAQRMLAGAAFSSPELRSSGEAALPESALLDRAGRG